MVTLDISFIINVGEEEHLVVSDEATHDDILAQLTARIEKGIH
jgi:hypothetical protein